MTKFTAALAEYKRKNSMNSTELAEKIGSNRYSVSRWLNGARSPTLETIRTVSKSLRIPLEQLL